MIKLPSGVNIKDLVNDLIILSWEASEKLLYYSQIVGDTKDKSNILKNENIDDPVTIADLTVNELIIQKIKEKYKHIDWDILSEENVKSDSHIALEILTGDGFWILLMEPKILFKDHQIMLCT